MKHLVALTVLSSCIFAGLFRLLRRPLPRRRKRPIRSQTYRSTIVPFLKKHCLECHGADAQEGDVRFDQYKDTAAVAADPKVWQRTIQMLRSGAMPPEDTDQPNEPHARSVVNWIERTIYNFDCDNGCRTRAGDDSPPEPRGIQQHDSRSVRHRP